MLYLPSWYFMHLCCYFCKKSSSVAPSLTPSLLTTRFYQSQVSPFGRGDICGSLGTYGIFSGVCPNCPWCCKHCNDLYPCWKINASNKSSQNCCTWRMVKACLNCRRKFDWSKHLLVFCLRNENEAHTICHIVSGIDVNYNFQIILRENTIVAREWFKDS